MNKFLRHMPAVAAYGQRLAALQNVWDSLSLLSQMSGDGTNIGQTREAFESLSKVLVQQLSAETAYKTNFEIRAKAQVAIDVMVRNLFERTADIGFLCSDDDIVAFMQAQTASDEPDAQQSRAIRKRLQEYAAKYSVYKNILLLAPDGRVLAQLDEHNAVSKSSDPLLTKTLRTSAAYVESFGKTDLLSSGEAGLIYSYRVEHQQQALGILCLCFHFEQETQAIFTKLSTADDWTILTLLDATGHVIASSDVYEMPIGAPLTTAFVEDDEITRFAGREYLTVTRRTQGYQGYMGPGWLAHAMVPLNHAFEHRSSQVLANIDPAVLANAQRSASIFSTELRAIPQQADLIQRELNKSVWNGNVKLVSRDGKENSFSKSLLREISATGRRTKEVFEQSIGDLHETVVSAILHDSRFRASLAIEIMDRNMYERANDCRWWALNPTLRDCLATQVDAQGDQSEQNQGDCSVTAVTQLLEQINALYTVYDNIILFDRQCQVIATSNVKRRALCGEILTQAWAREAITLRDSQSFVVSAFEPLATYDDRHTYVFTAAIRDANNHALGGIAVVFDSQPQFAAMLHDILPLTDAGAIAEGYCAMLVDSEGKVISASSHYQPGDQVQLPAHLLTPPPAGTVDIVVVNGHYQALGTRHCGGYREFKGTGVTAVVMRTLGKQLTQAHTKASVLAFTHRPKQSSETVDLAVVSCGEHWLAIASKNVVEAIDSASITRVPGRAAWFCGVTKYQGTMLPIIELGQWMNTSSDQSLRTIIVAQEAGQLIGLAVDQLGDVLTVGKDEIVTVDTLHNDAHTRLTPQLVRPRSADDSALLLLDVAALVNLLRSVPLQQESAPTESMQRSA